MESLTLVSPGFFPHEEARPGQIPRELQQLWFSLAGEQWKSLLLVPASGANALPLVKGLTQVARASGEHASMLDATDAAPAEIGGLAREIAARRERVLVAVDALDENPAAAALARCCDAALLCLLLGRSDVGSARRTVERLRARFLGSAVVLAR